MESRAKIYFIMIAIFSFSMLIISGCAKKVSTTQIGEPTKPEVEVSKPAAPEAITEAPVPKVEIPQEVALKEEPVKEKAPPSAIVKKINDIYFDFDRYLIRDDARGTLIENAGILKGKGFKRLVIEGHCDERGTTDYNIALGERRAESTKRYLTTLGISPSKISTISYGKERPFCTEHNEDCWQQNRRAHFVMSD